MVLSQAWHVGGGQRLSRGGAMAAKSNRKGWNDVVRDNGHGQESASGENATVALGISAKMQRWDTVLKAQLATLHCDKEQHRLRGSRSAMLNLSPLRNAARTTDASLNAVHLTPLVYSHRAQMIPGALIKARSATV
ncbi:hypothetical protein AAFF_G00368890 [Aldrovandia affinis]|uniref:Uncharacterized protein n=1 Tax=Aldrovandia affinis TaxID=143900 RepID=A0AAD7SH64_9TELE|nr:hypothetical protein AAFF_G00368890 [Aldrovandia affinis]